MKLEPKMSNQASAQPPEFAEPVLRKPLVLLRDTERSLRLRTVKTLAPLLPEAIATNLGEVSVVADESLDTLAKIELDKITDEELKPARIQMGLAFVGFGALAMAFLLLYLYTRHPELTVMSQVQHYWYQYIWFVCMGIAGLFMLGREAMRPSSLPDELSD